LPRRPGERRSPAAPDKPQEDEAGWCRQVLNEETREQTSSCGARGRRNVVGKGPHGPVEIEHARSDGTSSGSTCQTLEDATEASSGSRFASDNTIMPTAAAHSKS